MGWEKKETPSYSTARVEVIAVPDTARQGLEYCKAFGGIQGFAY